jgi:flagellar FliL protein
VGLLKNKLVLIIVAVLLLGGGGTYYFLFMGKKEKIEAKKKGHGKDIHAEGDDHGDEAHASEEQDQNEAVQESKKTHDEQEESDDEESNDDDEESRESGGQGGGHGESKGPIMEPFVVNLADPGSRRYLRMNLKIKLKKPEETEPLLEERMPQVRDAVLLLLSSKTSDQLSNPEGKISLRQELIDQLNKVLKKKKMKSTVKNLYFTEFLIQ